MEPEDILSLLLTLRGATTAATSRWVRIQFGKQVPGQGWKIHISANAENFLEVAHLCAPILCSLKTDFKIARNEDVLREISSDPVQAGKAITVYPENDWGAVEIASKLNFVLKDMIGPRISTDRRLEPGSVVHYGYGSFTQVEIDSCNRKRQYLLTPEGIKVPDKTALFYSPPTWAVDPFVSTGLASPFFPAVGPIGSKYTITHHVPASLNHVYLASSASDELVVIKSIRKHLSWKRDVCYSDFIKHEYDMLRKLDGRLGAPRAIELFEQEEFLTLVKEAIPSENISSYVRRRQYQFEPPQPSELLVLIEDAVNLVTSYRESGVVLGDISPENVVITTRGELRYIDFEYSHFRGDYWHKGGSFGFTAPPSFPTRTEFSASTYALVALIFFIATGKLCYVVGPTCIWPRVREYLRIFHPRVHARIFKTIKLLLRTEGLEA